ncbi:MAG: AarF/UbiB family protein [Culicoidibacterales bacterium]
MNAFSFIDLMYEIFKKPLPDLDKIQKKGLLAIKIAQTFALRIDFLDEKKCTHLSKLYTATTQIPEEDIDHLLKTYTDETWRGKFAEFDKKPLASASIGQVYRARLHDGREVAVKILKADFRQQFVKDVESVSRLFKFVIFFYPKLARVADPLGVLAEIRKNTLDELDFTNEIRNRDLLFEIFQQHQHQFDLSKLHFIEYIPELCSENVAVSYLIPGNTYDHELANENLPYERLLDLFKVHGFYLFNIGTFHGDIHPGNIIDLNQEIYFVDCGAIGHVSERMRQGLFHFMTALAFYDYDNCAKYLNAMSDIALTGAQYADFHKKLLTIYADFSESTVSEVSLTQKMMETIKLGVNCGMQFEQGIYPIIKSLMYLDGMVLRCNPDAKLMKDMRENVAILNPDVAVLYPKTN